MTLSAFALFLVLGQNAGPQVPLAPASIEGIALKTGTGESLAKVTIVVNQVPSLESSPALQAATAGNIEFQLLNSEVIRAAGNTIPNAPGSPRQSVTTGGDGKFLFENLRPGTYLITATSPGYSPTEYGQRGPNGHGIRFTLKAGQKMQNVTLTMTPEGSISGRVVDANGDPVSRALVQAQKVIYQENGRSLQTVQAVPTDDRGDYRLFWLPPGKYYISATPYDDRAPTIPVMVSGTNTLALNSVAYTAAGIVNLSGSIRDFALLPTAGVVPGVKVTSSTQANGEVIEEATVAVFYPSALDPSKSAPVDVRTGELTSGINITLTTTRVFRIHGMMIDTATGKPATAGTINLVSRNGPLMSQSASISIPANRTDFEIAGVVPGSYSLTGIGGTGVGTSGRGTAMVDVSAASVDNVIIPISPPISLSGHVTIEGILPNTNPGAARTVIIFNPQTTGLPSINIPMEPDGKFTVFGLMPGDYRLSFRVAIDLVPKSILYDGRDVQSEGLHIGDAAAGTLEIVLTSKGGRLEGNVSADRQQRAANATVVLMPLDALRQQTNLYQTVQSTAEGHYSIGNIPPGAYKLFAWDDIPDRAWFDAEFMRNFESQGREITIREGAMETLDIAVIPR